MKNTLHITKNILNRTLFVLVAAMLATVYLQAIILNNRVSAALITDRSLTLSSSSADAGNATTTYTFEFTLPTTGTALQSFEVEVCTTVSDSCITPTGFDASGATLSTQPADLGNDTGWTTGDSITGALRTSNTTGAAPEAGSITVVFDDVQNPTTANGTFFGRMTTYSDDSYTTVVDNGTVAASTTELIDLTGTVDETLVFETGTSGSCGSLSGTLVDFGTFTSTATTSGTSTMCASTNAASGYAITVNGSTLTCTTCSGSPTIAALSTQTTSATDTAQFGLNLKDNATPDVGAEVTGGGTGVASANYSTADQYRFVTGDEVAAAASTTDTNQYTVAYIVNIPGSQPAGVYTATMTYIATATF